jgi:hypothetical protein
MQYFSENMVALGREPRTSESVIPNSDHKNTEVLVILRVEFDTTNTLSTSTVSLGVVRRKGNPVSGGVSVPPYFWGIKILGHESQTRQ